MSPGHFRLAKAKGSAVLMPHFLAASDFASTMPWRFSSSPPMTEGMVLISSFSPNVSRR